MFDGGDDGKQPFVTAMGGGYALGFVDSTEVAVVVMKTAKFEARVLNCADQADDFGVMILLDTRAVHTRIDVEKNANAGTAPLNFLRFIFSEDRNADAGKGIGDFADATRIRTDHRIRDQYIARAGLAGDEEFERGGTLEIGDATVGHHAHGEGELCGFYMRAPAIGVSVENLQGCADIGSDRVGIDEQRGSHDIVGVFDKEATLPVESGEKHFGWGHGFPSGTER